MGLGLLLPMGGYAKAITTCAGNRTDDNFIIDAKKIIYKGKEIEPYESFSDKDKKCNR